MSTTATLVTPAVLTTEEAAIYLGLSHQTLANWRVHGEGPSTCVLETLAVLVSCISLRISMHFSVPTVLRQRVSRRVARDERKKSPRHRCGHRDDQFR